MLYLRYRVIAEGGGTRAQRRARESAAAHALLQELLAELRLPTGLKNDKNGRPFLIDAPQVDFNLSHTSGLAVCSLLTGITRPRVGVDAEEICRFDSARITALAQRFFAPHEQAHLATATDAATCFTRIFTRKEAYAKLCGNGLGAHLRATDTLTPDFEEAHGVRFYLYRHGDVFITLCVPREITEPPVTTLTPQIF